MQLSEIIHGYNSRWALAPGMLDELSIQYQKFAKRSATNQNWTEQDQDTFVRAYEILRAHGIRP
jgi:hypothetical protein